MTIKLTDAAFEDFSHWSKNDSKLLKKIFELLNNIQKEPFTGLGKPEQLKYDLSGYWSRRINEEHRLVYKIENEEIIIVSCRFHYTK
jgi:toxin YoeB